MEVFNEFMVGVQADNSGITILRPPMRKLSFDEALNLAAWIVAVADPMEEKFQPLLDAVRNT